MHLECSHKMEMDLLDTDIIVDKLLKYSVCV